MAAAAGESAHEHIDAAPVAAGADADMSTVAEGKPDEMTAQTGTGTFASSSTDTGSTSEHVVTSPAGVVIGADDHGVVEAGASTPRANRSAAAATLISPAVTPVMHFNTNFVSPGSSDGGPPMDYSDGDVTGVSSPTLSSPASVVSAPSGPSPLAGMASLGGTRQLVLRERGSPAAATSTAPAVPPTPPRRRSASTGGAAAAPAPSPSPTARHARARAIARKSVAALAAPAQLSEPTLNGSEDKTDAEAELQPPSVDVLNMALFEAARTGDVEECRLMLQQGASVNDRRLKAPHWNALMAASFNGHWLAVDVLIQSGARIDEVTEPLPVQYAISRWSHSCGVMLLCALRADRLMTRAAQHCIWQPHRDTASPSDYCSGQVPTSGSATSTIRRVLAMWCRLN